MLDKANTDQLKELTYVLVREYKAIDGACRQLDIGKHTMDSEKNKKIADLEEVIKNKDSHVREISQGVLQRTSGSGR